MTRSLLLSLLSRQCLLLKERAFRDRYPHGWLVWEAGVWHLPEIGEEMGVTSLPKLEMADCLPESDVVCFELAPTRRELSLGRALDNDIVINDATVSREHLKVGFDGASWWVQACPDCAESRIGGEPIGAQKVPLANGSVLRVGDVTLTYLDADSFVARVEQQSERLAAMAEDDDVVEDEELDEPASRAVS